MAELAFDDKKHMNAYIQGSSAERIAEDTEERLRPLRDPAKIYGLDKSMPKRNRFTFFCYRAVKRFLDILCSALFMIVFCWLYLIIAIAVKACDGGPVLYLQKRMGKDGKRMVLPKFRTMKVGADHLSISLTPEERKRYRQEYKLDNDPRITKVGKFLRKTSLDELPNVWLVFTGKMSIIGPRPLKRAEVEDKFGTAGKKLLTVKPGMTGWWACNGRNLVSYEDGERQKLELYYVDHCSLWMDTKIFFKTIVGVLKRTGAK